MEVCTWCGNNLANFATIWSAEGMLYCSEQCGKDDFNEAGEEDNHFDDVAEELNPADIGIMTTKGAHNE